MKSVLTCVQLALFLACGSTLLHAGTIPNYSIYTVGTLGGTSSEAFAINDYGFVAGRSRNASNVNRAILWYQGGLLDLGTLGGPSSEAWGINNRLMITGIADFSNGQPRAFLYSGNVMSNLGVRGGVWSAGLAINKHGDVSGVLEAASGAMHAFYWTPQLGITDLLVMRTNFNSYGLDISDSTNVTGWTYDIPVGGQERLRPFHWRDLNGNHTNDSNGQEMYVINPFQGRYGYGTVMTENGLISGWAETQNFGDGGGLRYIFLAGNSSTQNLFAVPGDQWAEPLDMSEGGVMVGWSENTNTGVRRAFAWQDGTYYNLNSRIPPGTGWNLLEAHDISANGWIAGVGTLSNKLRGFVLEPLATSLEITNIVSGIDSGNPHQVVVEWDHDGLGLRPIMEGKRILTNGGWSEMANGIPWPSTQEFWAADGTVVSQHVLRLRGVLP